MNLIELPAIKYIAALQRRNYAFNYDAGNTNSYTISNLQAGNTYYFAATAYDAYGNESDFSAEISHVVAIANNPPVAQSGTLTTNQDTPAGGRLNATDQDGDTLTYSITTQGSKGTAVITGTTTGNYTYTPNAGVYGTDTFFFRVRDPGGLTSTAAVTVTISKVNHAPVAQSGALTTNQDTPAGGRLNATDQDGDTLTYSITTQGSKGTAVITGTTTGNYTYTPNAGVYGTDTFYLPGQGPRRADLAPPRSPSPFPR